MKNLLGFYIFPVIYGDERKLGNQNYSNNYRNTIRMAAIYLLI